MCLTCIHRCWRGESPTWGNRALWEKGMVRSPGWWSLAEGVMVVRSDLRSAEAETPWCCSCCKGPDYVSGCEKKTQPIWEMKSLLVKWPRLVAAMGTMKFLLSQNREGKRRAQESAGKAELRWACFQSLCQVHLLFHPEIIIPGFLLTWPLWSGRVGNGDSGKGLFVPGFINKMPVVIQNVALEELKWDSSHIPNREEKSTLSGNIRSYMCKKLDVVNTWSLGLCGIHSSFNW